MINKIQEIIKQITDYLSDKEGFSTEVSNKNCVVKVTDPQGNDTQYDGYELLLYAIGSKKLGHEIELNIHDTDDGKVFAVNTKAQLDLRLYAIELNSELSTVDDEDIQSIVLCDQTGDQPHPFCLLTIYRNGNWMRQDLTMAELIYANTHKLSVEKVEGAYVFTKLRELSNQLIKEIQEAE